MGALTEALLLLGAALIALVLAEPALRRLPLSPAVIYLLLGWLAGMAIGAPDAAMLGQHATPMVVATEFAVLVSLFAVGLRLKVPPRLHVWRVALLMAGPGMVLTVVGATVAAMLLLDLSLAAALLLAAVVAPTDPVLASDVQIRSESDRDAVRLSLTAEGGLNDGTALPAVMLGLGLLGLHELGSGWQHWWLTDLVWPIGGGALIGAGMGWLLGALLRWQLNRGDPVVRDELLYVGAVALAYGVARAMHLSAFVVVFMVGATLLLPLRTATLSKRARPLTVRMGAFGARYERLVEAAMVLSVGVALSGVSIDLKDLLFALTVIVLVRPLAVWAIVRERTLPRVQRRLVAWFGIRGIGSLFYLSYALEHGVTGETGRALIAATLCCVAVSILLHGVSATPLMAAYQRRREAKRSTPAPIDAPPH